MISLDDDEAVELAATAAIAMLSGIVVAVVREIRRFSFYAWG